jgi:NADP-dependent 3-hydroxy acid dehydrogenase YdfG
MGLLDGKVALITGGTSGIGRVGALLFAQEGAQVAITGRREDAGRAVVEEITREGGEALFIKADATDFGGARDVVRQVVDRFGRLDVAFNNAGTAAVGPLTELDEKTWDHLVDGNLKGTFFYLQAEADQIKQQGGGGAIVLNGSVFAELGTPGISIYSASKGGVAALARRDPRQHREPDRHPHTADRGRHHEGGGRYRVPPARGEHPPRPHRRGRRGRPGGPLPPLRPVLLRHRPVDHGGRRAERELSAGAAVSCTNRTPGA